MMGDVIYNEKPCLSPSNKNLFGKKLKLHQHVRYFVLTNPNEM